MRMIPDVQRSQANSLSQTRAGLLKILLQRTINPSGIKNLPVMIVVSSKVRVMGTAVTAALFNQVMEGYQANGHRADDLNEILNSPSKAGKILTYISLFDAVKFAKRLSEKTGRNFRVPTEDEYLAARRELSGDHCVWTRTRFSRETYILRDRNSDRRWIELPYARHANYVVYLVEYVAG